MLDNIKWKSEVEFSADSDRNIIEIRSVGGGGEQKEAPAKRGNGGRSGGGGGFNEEKRQAVIVFQSARNAATELVTACLTAGALALPSKKGDQFDALQCLVDTLTERYYEENMEVYRTGQLPEGFSDA